MDHCGYVLIQEELLHFFSISALYKSTLSHSFSSIEVLGTNRYPEAPVKQWVCFLKSMQNQSVMTAGTICITFPGCFLKPTISTLLSIWIPPACNLNQALENWDPAPSGSNEKEMSSCLSSAYWQHSSLDLLSASLCTFIYRLNRWDDRPELCGTLQETVFGAVEQLPNPNLWYLSERKKWSHSWVSLSICAKTTNPCN